jgi:hypothetical protein
MNARSPSITSFAGHAARIAEIADELVPAVDVPRA